MPWKRQPEIKADKRADVKLEDNSPIAWYPNPIKLMVYRYISQPYPIRIQIVLSDGGDGLNLQLITITIVYWQETRRTVLYLQVYIYNKWSASEYGNSQCKECPQAEHMPRCRLKAYYISKAIILNVVAWYGYLNLERSHNAWVVDASQHHRSELLIELVVMGSTGSTQCRGENVTSKDGYG